jgi:hypothetical protein
LGEKVHPFELIVATLGKIVQMIELLVTKLAGFSLKFGQNA